MNNNRNLSAVALAASLLLALPVGAQTPAPAPAPAASGTRLTLSQAWQLALRNDAQLAAVRSRTDARRERVPQARSQLLPNVSAQVSRFKNDLESTTANPVTGAPFTSEREYFSSTKALVARQPLFRPALVFDYRQAQAQVREAEAQLDGETQNLAVRVTTTYLDALLAQEQLALVDAQKTAYTTQLEAARRRLAGGAGTRTDIDEAQARLDMAIARELEARQNVDFTRRQLQMLTGQTVTDLARVDPARLPLVPPVPATLAEWVQRAEAVSPEIRALVAQREAAQHEVNKARSGHLPTLDAIAQWSRNENDSVNNLNTRYDNKQLGFQLNVPIFSGGLVNSQVRQARADLERTENALEAARRDLSLRVEKEFRGVTEGVLRVRALEQALRSSQTAAESARRSFQAGSRTLVDVLNAEEQRVSTERDLAQARFGYMLARIRLLALSGDVNEAQVEGVNQWLAP